MIAKTSVWMAGSWFQVTGDWLKTATSKRTRGSGYFIAKKGFIIVMLAKMIPDQRLFLQLLTQGFSEQPIWMKFRHKDRLL